MIVKECEFCKKDSKMVRSDQKFCSVVCQKRDYNKRPEVREKNRIRAREYRKNNPKWRERHRLLARKHKEKRSTYNKEYFQRSEVKARRRKRARLRRKRDKHYAIADRLRRSLNHALTKYSKKGKMMKSKKYGLDWEEVIENLKPFPEEIEKFEIDHITPLHTFNLDDKEEIKKAFHYSNLQWLIKIENRRKGGKIMETKNLNLGGN